MATCVPCDELTGVPPSLSGGNSGRQSVISSERTVGLLRRVSICTARRWACAALFVFDWIMVAVPVVSCPYIPAALMPIPCCPRDIRRRWNLDP